MIILRVVPFLLLISRLSFPADIAVIADATNYNVGDEVRLRLNPSGAGTASIRYAGENQALARDLRVSGSEYQVIWKVPSSARTGRYMVDFAPARRGEIQNATSFAVHRQFAKVVSVELDKTFYTEGDAVNPRIVVKNLSDRPLDHLQVEFEPYTYSWIAPDPDEPQSWKYIVARSLSLGPGEEKDFRVTRATVARVQKNEPQALYYSVVIRSGRDPDRIYDLAFALPAFTIPPNKFLPKQYPFLYLYRHLAEVPKSESYRHFYPPQFISDVVKFKTDHTMFPAETHVKLGFSVKPGQGSFWDRSRLRARVVDAQGKTIQNETLSEPPAGAHDFASKALPPGLYSLHISVEEPDGAVIAQNQVEFAINPLPKSILIFLAHQDDDTAHPALIRAAVENHIPIHFVYLTGGDSGGCDRFYMHSCDAARAMDFGEVRMEESRASLGHMGVRREDIEFLGLPDGGLEQIWYHNRKAGDPYLSVLLASDHAPYRNAAIPNLPYALDPIVAAVKDYIAKFQPELIVTGHPDERHVDHRTNNWIAVKAMQQLLREGRISRTTQLLVDIAYGAKPGRHAPYRFKKDTFYCSGEAARIGQEALWYYQSQDGNHQQAEIKEFADLPRTEAWPHVRILDWWEHEGWNDQPETK